MVRPLGAQQLGEETKEKGLLGREYEMPCPLPHFPCIQAQAVKG